jgi:hypothetical protein
MLGGFRSRMFRLQAFIFSSERIAVLLQTVAGSRQLVHPNTEVSIALLERSHLGFQLLVFVSSFGVLARRKRRAIVTSLLKSPEYLIAWFLLFGIWTANSFNSLGGQQSKELPRGPPRFLLELDGKTQIWVVCADDPKQVIASCFLQS